MKHAFIFPGQGSQSVGMLSDLASHHTIVQDTFAEASDVLGYDLWELAQQGPKETLDQTDKTQPALLASSVAIWRVWKRLGKTLPAMMAGHSFGEYSALVCAEALDFRDAVSLAQDRGRFMQTAVPEGEGAMAAILGLDDETVENVCQQAAQGHVVSAVNFNAPGQVVVAGHKAAVERAVVEAKNAGAKKSIVLPVSVPAHSSLMKPAADKMAERLATVTFHPPKVPVLHNADCCAQHTQAEEIREALVKQLYYPVNWVKTIQTMANQGITLFFEMGPGKVLTGLNKRIDKKIITYPTDSQEILNQAAIQSAYVSTYMHSQSQ